MILFSYSRAYHCPKTICFTKCTALANLLLETKVKKSFKNTKFLDRNFSSKSHLHHRWLSITIYTFISYNVSQTNWNFKSWKEVKVNWSLGLVRTEWTAKKSTIYTCLLIIWMQCFQEKSPRAIKTVAVWYLNFRLVLFV
jgi:hypothetical protein